VQAAACQAKGKGVTLRKKQKTAFSARSLPAGSGSLTQLVFTEAYTYMLIDDEDEAEWLEADRERALRDEELAQADAAARSADLPAAAAAAAEAEARAAETRVELTPEGASMLPLMRDLIAAYEKGGVGEAAGQMRLIDIRFGLLKKAVAAAVARRDGEEEDAGAASET